ncbi:MAG TPA: bifunctional DNA-formamidopyrimidine glycosylase/DNA-(apurinic or apyrimidinic site) lyase [Rubrivivax sp.]|nr:bifunctional DNA-formamidopyrimidine glycosylase/DNA-(apurinic or apyrimidinic site) lyase [Burkholderiales bacterium]HNU10682.1 bifunctional DNA-formamidopyrimidine glycosylase/DNA-(apurinic or apyrimidinic site) lyase [Rubrivivax sp.]
MPELPEVEVTRRSIDLPLRGARIQALHLGKPLRWPLGRDPAALLGLRLGPIVRRGKYLWLPLHGEEPAKGHACDERDERDERADGDENPSAQGLLLHLGMSGSLALLPAPQPPGPHDHFQLDTDRGSLRMTDPRRFGAVVWSPGLDREPAARLLRALGPEPFDPALTEERFHAALRQHRAPIKTVLLSGRVVVGAGNIYACEALFHAGIDPRRSAARIGKARSARLLHALRSTLSRAMALGGSTLRDFRNPHGMDGAFQAQAAVYGREGQACPRCATPLSRIVQGQRSTYFCRRCQRR